MAEENDPSNQLQSTLRESITRSLSTRRPLLTHLNADTTWLLSLPYPESAQTGNGRIYFHILIDPWLKGGQSDVAKFFSQQWHKEESIVQTIREIEEAISGIEDVARGELQFGLDSGEGDVIVVDTGDTDIQMEVKEPAAEEGNWIDAVVVSHEFTDHMHKETLLEISPRVPVFATVKAASAIRSWRHFDSVFEVPRFTGDWRDSSREPLPDWLGVSRVAYPGADMLYYHSAIMITFTLSPLIEEGVAEAVIYTPHGVSTSDLAPVASASPNIQTLALLHGLYDIKLGAQLNMGAHNGLKVQRLLGAKYWVGTHDELKRGGGIVSYFLDRKMITLGEAIEKEKQERLRRGESLKGSGLEDLSDVRFEELGNGVSLILE